MLLAVGPASASGGVSYYVTTAGGSPTCATAANDSADPFGTIQGALDCAATDSTTALSPDTIDVAAGTYAEHVTVSADVSLVGAGAALTAIDGTSSGIPLTVGSAETVSASGLTIENGSSHSFGGGVDSLGTLTLSEDVIAGNTVSAGPPGCSVTCVASGGGVYSAGPLTLGDDTFSGNAATIANSFCTSACDFSAQGAAVFSNGPVTMTGDTVSANSASVGDSACTASCNEDASGGGIFVEGLGAGLTLTNDTVSGNNATSTATGCSASCSPAAEGGGLFVATPSTGLTLSGSIVSGNTASAMAPACSSACDASLRGGAIFDLRVGAVSVSGSALSRNQLTASLPTCATACTASAQGGGMFSDDLGFAASLALTASTVSASSLTVAAPVCASGCSLTSAGGAAFGEGPVTEVAVNDTLAGNGGGGLDLQGTVSAVNDTIADNDGVGVAGSSSTTLANTVLAGNAGGNCGGAVSDGGHNISFPATDTSCPGTFAGGDPELGPLVDNGGVATLPDGSHLQTMALAGSAAIDAVPLAGCTTTSDERGFLRPDNAESSCDIGAYESQADDDLALTSVPADVTVDAASPGGAVVAYTPPTVVDEDSPPPAVNCLPASGSTFPVGTTTVSCTTTDADDSNSPVTASFTVTVDGAAAQLLDLETYLAGLPHGQLLLATARLAIRFDQERLTRASCLTLSALIAEADWLSAFPVRAPFLSAAEAQTVIADVVRIRSLLAC